jgi:hypothetical protein
MKSYVDPTIPDLLSQNLQLDSRRGSISEEESYSKNFIENLDQIGTIFDQNLFE